MNPDTRPIYLDYNASTPIDPAALETMVSVLRDEYGNPSSQHHSRGRKASDIIENARRQTAQLIHASPSEIIFTSGATESCNLAIKGAAAAYREKGNHIITSMAEHKAVLQPLKQLANHDFDITFLRPDAFGRAAPEQIEAAMTERTILVCVMAANNVLGTLNPIADIARRCKKRGVLFFSDTTQAAGKLPLDVEQTGLDLASLSAHKMYGPKGTGALYVRSSGPRVRLEPQILGGGQERGLRGGTENVAGIAGMGAACELAERLLADESERVAGLRERFEKEILKTISGVEIIAGGVARLPNTTMLTVSDVRAERLLRALSADLAASTGSACDSAGGDSNYVLKAIGLEQDKIAGAIRFSLGRFTTPDAIADAVTALSREIGLLRNEARQGG